MILVFFLMIRRPPRSTRTDTLCPYTTLFRSMLLPQVECLLGRKLGEDDDGLGLPSAQRSEVRLAVSNGLELDALDEQQFAVLDEQHLVADEIGRAHV